jgi:hypothetical protein
MYVLPMAKLLIMGEGKLLFSTARINLDLVLKHFSQMQLIEILLITLRNTIGSRDFV